MSCILLALNPTADVAEMVSDTKITRMKDGFCTQVISEALCFPMGFDVSIDRLVAPTNGLGYAVSVL